MVRKKLRLHRCEIRKLVFEATRDAQVQILVSFAEQSVVPNQSVVEQECRVRRRAIVCRVSNVDITARSCELTFRGAKQTVTGRRASEIFATEIMSGVPTDGAAGSMFESFSKLNCTLDPAEIRKKAGDGQLAGVLLSADR